MDDYWVVCGKVLWLLIENDDICVIFSYVWFFDGLMQNDIVGLFWFMGLLGYDVWCGDGWGLFLFDYYCSFGLMVLLVYQDVCEIYVNNLGIEVMYDFNVNLCLIVMIGWMKLLIECYLINEGMLGEFMMVDGVFW